MRRASRVDLRYVGPGSPGLVEGVAGTRVLRSTTLVRRAAVALVALAVATLALAARADAFVYWTDEGNVAIGRANLDGTSVNQGFISDAAPGTNSPWGVAVDGAHLYWATGGANTIARANLDGSGVNLSFITGPSGPLGVAVDGAHIYWANFDGGSIGRANLDGTGVNESFITGADFPNGVAVDGAHVYWAEGNTIARANLDGTGVNHSFITGASGPGGVAVDGAHVYWANVTGNTIGRANLDGTGVNERFITGATTPTDVAVDGAHVYWADSDAGTIGRANLDGTGVNQSFITATYPIGVAVDALLGAPPRAQHFLTVLPSRTNPGKTITVSGSVGNGCQTGHKGDTATIYSNAFKGATKHSFAGVPAVYASLSKSKTGAFSFKLKLSKKLRTGSYLVGGRCGGGKFGSAKLKVVKAASLQSPPPHPLLTSGTGSDANPYTAECNPPVPQSTD